MATDAEGGVPTTSPSKPRLHQRFSTLKYTTNKLTWSGSNLIKNNSNTSKPLVFDASESSEGLVDWEKPQASPVQTEQQSMFRTGLPEVIRREQSTLLELFSDLFFVATLNVFSAAHEIVRAEDLASYAEFLFLLWSTWFLVVIRDVRFLSDSWTERVFLALHLGIMIAFTEIAPFFRAMIEIDGVAISTSLTLMVSRVILTLQYGITAFHLRWYIDARKPMMAVLLLHIIAACLYAAIAAACASSMESQAHQLLLLVASLEIITHLAITLKPEFTIITFEKTHLAERLKLLTLIILGEGIIKLAKDVSLIEHNLGWAPWSASMWLVFLSGVAVVYIIFQVYSDWMHPNDMVNRRQLSWTVIHAPFHFALLLVMEAVNQFIIWWRIREILDQTSSDLFAALRPDTNSTGEPITTQEISARLNETAMGVLDKFTGSENIRGILDNVIGRVNDIAELPQAALDVVASSGRLSNYDLADLELGDGEGTAESPMVRLVLTKLGQLLSALTEAVFSSFELQPFDDVGTEMTFDETMMQVDKSFGLVFVYAFVAAGSLLILLTALHAVSKLRGWTRFNIMRSVLIVLLGIGLGLVPIAIKNKSLDSPIWTLPLIFAVFMVVLMITHAPHPKIKVPETVDLEDGRRSDSEG